MEETKNAILITGAAGGLGKSLVEMSKTIPNVDYIIATDINSEVAKIYSSDSGIIGLKMDVSSEKSIVKVKKQLDELGITVSYIINNAGIFMFQPVSEMTEKMLDKILKVNIYGPVLTISVFMEHLVKTRGRVIQISSHSVKFPTLFQPYPASKIALEAFSTSIRQELGLLGINLVLIRSGAIKTDLIKELDSPEVPAESSKYNNHLKKFIKRAQKDVGKSVEPAKVAILVKKALTESRPKNVYQINRNKTIMMMSYLPQRWIDFLIRKMVN